MLKIFEGVNIKIYQKNAAILLVDRLMSILQKYFLAIIEYSNKKYAEQLRFQRLRLVNLVIDFSK